MAAFTAPSPLASQVDPSGEVLRFEDVNLRFDSVVALDHVSFTMRPGETRVILGEAGAGKTMLVKCAVGLVRPDSGRIDLLGQEVTTMSEHDLFDLRSRVGILFQEGGLFDSMTIEENVSYPLLNRRSQRVTGEAGFAEVFRRVKESLTFVELGHTLDKFPNELSGGMRRRVGIARATVTEPALVLYDSPTAGLDPITANTIIALIVKEREMRNAAAIMVTHRYQDGHLMANFRYNSQSGRLERLKSGADSKTTFMVMREGRIVFEGTQAELEASTDDYISKFPRMGHKPGEKPKRN